MRPSHSELTENTRTIFARSMGLTAKEAMNSNSAVLIITAFVMTCCATFLVGCAGQPSEIAPAKKQNQTIQQKKNSSKVVLHKRDYLRKTEDIQNPIIVVSKSKRRLYVFDGDTLVREYPIGLGKNPIGDKERANDGKTPEGEFKICGKNPKSRFYKSVAIDYPTPEDAEKAFSKGIITADQYKAIIMAHERGVMPPGDTPLGGYIFIHGGGAYGDWTDGCIALYNTDMDELYEIVSLGTPVYILP